MFGLSIVPAVLQGTAMLALPRSTRWLLMHGRRAEARAALAVRAIPVTLGATAASRPRVQATTFRYAAHARLQPPAIEATRCACPFQGHPA